MIELRPANSGGYRAYYGNGYLLGDILKEVDGYYVWWPQDGVGGFWTDNVLREIADCLQKLNAEWDNQVRRDCCGPSSESVGRNYIPSQEETGPVLGETNGNGL